MRPDWDHYLMGIAKAVRKRADCQGRKVGAVLSLQGRVLSTGYNGTPSGMPNCSEGGCVRCADRERYSTQDNKNYDLCICVHGEMNAILTAARFGVRLEGSTCYSTCQPCFSCAKELLQAGVIRVVYDEEFTYNEVGLSAQYAAISAAFPGGINPILDEVKV